MSDTTGQIPDAPVLAPGTYELTKRVEVSEDSVARFVDMPDGLGAEYVKGFWHNTRSQVRKIEPGQAPVSEGMVEAAARQLYGGPVHRFKAEGDDLIEYTVTWDEVVAKVGEAERDAYLSQARRILSAALAGRTVVELPEPDGVDEGVLVWALPHGEIQASQGAGEGLIYEAHGDYLLPAEAELYGAALIAAAREARRLASESSQDGGNEC